MQSSIVAYKVRVQRLLILRGLPRPFSRPGRFHKRPQMKGRSERQKKYSFPNQDSNLEPLTQSFQSPTLYQLSYLDLVIIPIQELLIICLIRGIQRTLVDTYYSCVHVVLLNCDQQQQHCQPALTQQLSKILIESNDAMPEKSVSTNERVKKRHGPVRFRDKK